ncbi:MAG: hypothetical protein CMP39_04230 [Rickettsiales bacterium]|nr:hypothetical protein [Rickettsiales bacterium]|tara:strand:- start:131 stop:478 length:348 start_codon:yes stop_codon:yes gene_type:complete
MWIFTKDGFLSVVQHNKLKDSFLVRARNEQHLNNLFPWIKVVRVQRSDYPCRITVEKYTFMVEFCMKQVEKISYCNFKDSIEEVGYKEVCHQVWEEMAYYGNEVEEKGVNYPIAL